MKEAHYFFFLEAVIPLYFISLTSTNHKSKFCRCVRFPTAISMRETASDMYYPGVLMRFAKFPPPVERDTAATGTYFIFALLPFEIPSPVQIFCWFCGTQRRLPPSSDNSNYFPQISSNTALLEHRLKNKMMHEKRASS